MDGLMGDCHGEVQSDTTPDLTSVITAAGAGWGTARDPPKACSRTAVHRL